jgi:hypothetical protein
MILGFPGLLIWRILDRIVAKVKAFTLMDGIADPLAKVCIAEHALASRIFLRYQFL